MSRSATQSNAKNTGFKRFIRASLFSSLLCRSTSPRHQPRKRASTDCQTPQVGCPIKGSVRNNITPAANDAEVPPLGEEHAAGREHDAPQGGSKPRPGRCRQRNSARRPPQAAHREQSSMCVTPNRRKSRTRSPPAQWPENSNPPTNPQTWVVIAMGSHLFPFRTEQLSPSTPMVLQLACGRVGSRLNTEKSNESWTSLFFRCADL